MHEKAMAKKMRKKKGRETTKKDTIHSTGQETRGRRTSKESQDSVKILVAPEAKIFFFVIRFQDVNRQERIFLHIHYTIQGKDRVRS